MMESLALMTTSLLRMQATRHNISQCLRALGVVRIRDEEAKGERAGYRGVW